MSISHAARAGVPTAIDAFDVRPVPMHGCERSIAVAQFGRRLGLHNLVIAYNGYCWLVVPETSLDRLWLPRPQSSNVRVIPSRGGSYAEAIRLSEGIAAYEAALRLRDDGRFGSRLPKLHLVQTGPVTAIHDAWSAAHAASAGTSDPRPTAQAGSMRRNTYCCTSPEAVRNVSSGTFERIARSPAAVHSDPARNCRSTSSVMTRHRSDTPTSVTTSL
jgi:hypothetical protein